MLKNSDRENAAQPIESVHRTASDVIGWMIPSVPFILMSSFGDIIMNTVRLKINDIILMFKYRPQEPPDLENEYNGVVAQLLHKL